jgi:hypothetical protein
MRGAVIIATIFAISCAVLPVNSRVISSGECYQCPHYWGAPSGFGKDLKYPNKDKTPAGTVLGSGCAVILFPITECHGKKLSMTFRTIADQMDELHINDFGYYSVSFCQRVLDTNHAIEIGVNVFLDDTKVYEARYYKRVCSKGTCWAGIQESLKAEYSGVSIAFPGRPSGWVNSYFGGDTDSFPAHFIVDYLPNN